MKRHFAAGKPDMDLYLFDNMLAAKSADELLTATQGVVGALGFQRFVYALRRFKPEGGVDDFFFGTYPETWQSHYHSMGYVLIDPTVSHCFSKTTPIVWTHSLFAEAGAAQLHDDAIQCGVSAGVCFPVHNVSPKGSAIVGLTNEDDTDRAASLGLNVLGRGQLFACYLNEAVHKLLRIEDLSLVTMGRYSGRELECLKWAAQGLSTKQIADKLNLGDDGVNFHFRNAFRKLKVANRRQAIARAISYGLISP